jgi:WD40 repeat protein
MLGVIAVVLVSRQQAMNAALGAEASKLVALGQVELDEFPTAALAYATKSLELSDTLEARLFALRALSRGPIATLTPPADAASSPVAPPAFSPNGEWLALGGWRMADVFHRDGGKPLRLGHDYPEEPGRVGVGFGPRSDVLVTNRQGDVRIWSLPEARELRRGQFEEGPSGTFITDRGFVTSTTVGDREVMHWWPFGGEDESRLLGTMEPIGTADVAHGRLAYPRGRKIYSRSLDDWSSPPKLLAEHSFDVLSVAFSADGGRLAASDESGEVRIWSAEVQDVRLLRVLRGNVDGLRFDPSGTRLAGTARGGERASLLWDLTAPPGAEPLILRRSDYNSRYWMGVAFDPSGDWLATSNAGDAALWRLDGDYPHVLEHGGNWSTVAFTPDGKWLIVAGDDQTVRAWPLSAERNQEHGILLPVGAALPQVAVDPTSGYVVLCTGRRILDVPLTGEPAREIARFEVPGGLSPIALGDGGRLVATGSHDAIVRVLDRETGTLRELPRVPGLEKTGAYVGALQFLDRDRLLETVRGSGLVLYDLRAGTGRLLAPQPRSQFQVGHDGRVGVGMTRDPEDGIPPTELIRFSLEGGEPETLESHGREVSAVALDPSETRVATGSVDGTVRIGPVSGEEPHVFFGHEGVVLRVAFSPDGRWLTSTGTDRKVRLWPVPDVSEPPLHKLPYQDLLTDLRSRTNLRVVPAPDSATGWKLDRDPFPGWARRPER